MVLDTISPADLSIDDGVMAGNEVTIAEARYTLNGTYVLELGKKRAIRFSMLIDWHTQIENGNRLPDSGLRNCESASPISIVPYPFQLSHLGIWIADGEKVLEPVEVAVAEGKPRISTGSVSLRWSTTPKY
jgi:hypothetical protein